MSPIPKYSAAVEPTRFLQPPLPNDVRVGAAKRYIEAYERITGQEFVPNTDPPLPRIKANLGLS